MVSNCPPQGRNAVPERKIQNCCAEMYILIPSAKTQENKNRHKQLNGKTLDSNDRNQVADLRFSLKQWFAVGIHSCRLRKTGSAHCYLRISS